LAGAHFGYNWQYGRFVGGLEADFDAADIKSTANVPVLPPLQAPSPISQAVKTDALASIRGRLGWTVTPNLLAYGTGGIALGQFQSTLTQPSPYQSNTGANTETGWVAGAGFEYKILENWMLRAEYLHYDFGLINNNINTDGFSPHLDGTIARNTVDVVRGGLSYKFGPEGAAELGLKDTASVSGWSGFYVGIHGGSGWAHTDFPQGITDPSEIASFGYLNNAFPPAPAQSSSGGVFGGHFGYNWQYGRAVAGIEADIDAAGIKSTSNLAPPGVTAINETVKIDQLASVRARLGWELWPSLLAYGTGGIGLGHFQNSYNQMPVPYFGGTIGINSNSGANTFGWVAGAGVEYKILENLLLRAEYLHYGFGKVNQTYTGLDSWPVAFDIDMARPTVDVVRGGLSYKFGPKGAADSSLKDPGYVSDWSGLYAGIDGGGGWATTDFLPGFGLTYTAVGFNGYQDLVLPAQKSSGGLVGGHLGYNWQYERLVGGLEADFDFTDIKSTANLPYTVTQQIKIDDLASVRARLGWTVWDNLLAYGTGGLALGHFQSNYVQTVAANPGAGYGPLYTAGGGAEFGWVAGAGLEYKLLDHWLLRAEYLHYGFGTINHLLLSVSSAPPQPAPPAPTALYDGTFGRTTVDAVRAGLSYKF
jgi:outer membrane immunogenic protein